MPLSLVDHPQSSDVTIRTINKMTNTAATPDDIAKFVRLVNALTKITEDPEYPDEHPAIELNDVPKLKQRLDFLSGGYFKKGKTVLHQAATALARNRLYNDKTRRITAELENLCHEVKMCGSCHTADCLLKMMQESIQLREERSARRRIADKYARRKHNQLLLERSMRTRNPIGT